MHLHIAVVTELLRNRHVTDVVAVTIIFNKNSERSLKLAVAA